MKSSRRRAFKAGCVGLGAVAILSGLTAAACRKPKNPFADANCREVSAVVREGDLLFLENDNFLYRRVARASGGLTSHVGVALHDPERGWYVAESRVPKVTLTPLCEYLARTHLDHFAVRRPREPLSEEGLRAMKEVAHELVGKRYDFGFDLERDSRTFCSKFVNQLYARGAGYEVGRRETFGILMRRVAETSEAASDLRFWRAWYLGRVPTERVTVTPQSQLEDERLETVLDTFGRHAAPTVEPAST